MSHGVPGVHLCVSTVVKRHPRSRTGLTWWARWVELKRERSEVVQIGTTSVSLGQTMTDEMVPTADRHESMQETEGRSSDRITPPKSIAAYGRS